MDNKKINLAVVGCGYWGPNLVRNFVQLQDVNVSALCDLDISKACAVQHDYVPNVQVLTDYSSIINDPQVFAVVIATPAYSHFDIAQSALNASKHVFVEKPLAMSVLECQKLIHLARQADLVLMVGHTFRYNIAIRKIKEYIDDGFLGDIIYIYTRRLNLGKIRTDVNALWSLGPHDISTLLYWLGEAPIKVTSSGFSYLNSNIEDVVFMALEFSSGIKTYSHLSWLDPKKVREITIVGTEKMLIYNDIATEGKIQIYDKCISRYRDPHFQYEHSYAEFQMRGRYGDMSVPYLPFHEPLQLECQHFVDCIRSKAIPLTDGYEGLRVVRVLEGAQESLKHKNISVDLLQEKKRAQVNSQYVPQALSIGDFK